MVLVEFHRAFLYTILNHVCTYSGNNKGGNFCDDYHVLKEVASLQQTLFLKDVQSVEHISKNTCVSDVFMCECPKTVYLSYVVDM